MSNKENDVFYETAKEAEESIIREKSQDVKYEMDKAYDNSDEAYMNEYDNGSL